MDPTYDVTDGFPDPIAENIALRARVAELEEERDEAIEEMEGAVKLREAADACITRLEASCYQWQAENRALYERAASQCAICEDKNECDGCPYEGFAQLAPLTAAEVERVKRLEAVLEAAEAQDPPASANLARALSAYREGESNG